MSSGDQFRRRAAAAPDDRLLARIDEAASLLAPAGELAQWFATYHQTHRERLALDLGEVLAAWPSAGEDAGAGVLEVGAAPYLLTVALQLEGRRVQALDLDPERFAASTARLELRVHACDIERDPLPFESSSLELVLFNELFEHLRIDPIFTLQEVHRVLRPGGTLLLSTPNLRSFRGLRNLLLRDQGHACSGGVYRQYEKLRRLGHMGHVREYTTSEVVDFLAQVGFRTVEVTYRDGHGRGLVGLLERAWPSMRPAFQLRAVRAQDAASASENDGASR